MTSYTNLKSRLRDAQQYAMLDGEKLDAIVDCALAAIEELERFWIAAKQTQMLVWQNPQLMGGSLVGDESHRRSAEGAEGCHDAPKASGEPPAQSAPAPAAEPVLFVRLRNGKPDWKADFCVADHPAELSDCDACDESEGVAVVPLYAAPQPAQADEARELLREVDQLNEGRGYMWNSAKLADLLPRIRAYLARTGGKEAK